MSLPPYSAYKATGVPWLGEVPAHWDIVQVRHLAWVEGGSTPPEKEILASGDEGHAWATPADMEGWHSELSSTSRSITDTGLTVIGGFVAQPGDVLFSSRAPVGKVAIVVRAMAFNQGCKAIIPKPGIHGRFLAWQLDAARNAFDLAARGTTFSEVSTGSIQGVLLARPPSPEQQAIAAFLNRETAKLDALVSEQKGLLALLSEKRKAAIISVVARGLYPNAQTAESGLGWVGRVPAHWKVARIGYYASVENGSTPSKENLDYWNDGAVAWVASGEVNQYLVTEPTDYISKLAVAECGLRVLPKGAVLVGLIGQGRTRAMSAILGIPAAINQNVAAMTAKEDLLPSYLHYCLQAAYGFMRECARGGNQAALNCELLAAFRIPIPPLDEQEGIVRHLDRLHASTALLMAECQASVALLQELRGALISAAVTGKSDVRGFAAAGTPERAAA